jgi:type II restriction/modification system DNA methylase subunit YeeA
MLGQRQGAILESLDTIRLQDALLDRSDPGHPREATWPAADVIIGNPPFLGGKRLRAELGDAYVDDLFAVYDKRVAREADLVCYFFEKARARIEHDQTQRAGLLATNSIRGGANREVLQRVKASGDIFLAWDDEPWILDGAAVRISIVGFDDGTEPERTLDGEPVTTINADLTSSVDITRAKRLPENEGIAFQGPVKVGAFDITPELASAMISAPTNPNGRTNRDVIRPWVNGMDIVRRPRGMSIIDFGKMSLEEASLYEMPFEYVRANIKPSRDSNRDYQRRTYWWRLGRSGDDWKSASGGLSRVIITPRVATHRLFAWFDGETLPDSATVGFARDDDYFFGVLHSRAHEVWSLRMGTWLGVGNDPRYTPTTCFETFPFPRPDDAQREAIAAAAQRLDALRRNWLNPPGADAATLKKRTLTNLYNERPTWLANAHAALDRAVWSAYGWPEPPEESDDETILARLLALNLARADDA